MGIDRVVYTPTVTIDQDRYEELIRHELQYEQYKQAADSTVIEIIEADGAIKLIEEARTINNE